MLLNTETFTRFFKRIRIPLSMRSLSIALSIALSIGVAWPLQHMGDNENDLVVNSSLRAVVFRALLHHFIIACILIGILRSIHHGNHVCILSASVFTI